MPRPPEPHTSTPAAYRYAYAICVAAASVLAVLVRLPLVDRPLDRDEGLYAYMAQRMSQGDVPYRDVFSDKPPVGFALYWLFFRLFGESPSAAHLGGALWVGLAVVALAACVRSLGGSRWTAVAAAFLFAVHNAQAALQGASINLELLLLPFALASIAILGYTTRPLAALAAGVLMGLAGLTKQQAVGYAFFGLVLLVLEPRPGLRRSRRLQLLAAYIAGGLLLVAAVGALFALVGSLSHLIEGVLTYNVRSYVRREPLGRAPLNFARAAWPLLVSNPLLYLLAIAGLVAPASAAPTRTVLAWWLVPAFVSVSLGFRYYPHYFELTAPVVCVLAARALDLVRVRVELLWPVALLATAGLPLLTDFDYFFRWDARRHVHELYGPELFHQSKPIADELRRRTAATEAVFIFGSEPQIYFLAARRCAVRYAFIHPLTVAAPQAAELQRVVARRLREAPPAAIVLVMVDMSHMYEPGAADHLERAVTELCRTRYRPTLIVYDDRTRSLAPDARLGRALLRGAVAVVYVRDGPAATRR